MFKNLSDFSQILWQSYDQFMLPLGGKKVPAPYRRNEIGSYQRVGPEFQGKSSPETLVRATERLAREQNFNLSEASIEDIRKFMQKNKLGIDCSGFVYRMLDFLTQKLGMGNLEKAAGFEHVGRTNVKKLTSEEFTDAVNELPQSQAGDLIRLNSHEDIPHVMIILENKNGIITYAHSTSESTPNGVRSGEISGNKIPEKMEYSSFNPVHGDGIRRLKIFNKNPDQT